jgi:hypothetical protein
MIETIFLGLCTVISLGDLKRPFKSPNDLSTTCREDAITKSSPFSAFSDKEEFFNTLPPC